MIDPLVQLGLFLSSTVIITTLLSVILRLIVPTPYVVWLIPIVGVFLFFQNREKLLKKILNLFQDLASRSYAIVYLVIILAVLTQNVVMYRGGWKTLDGYMFPSMHDTMWSLSISAELVNHFPPQHPGVSGSLLKNHHFFYPLFLANLNILSWISLVDLYFRLGPLFVSLLFGLSIYTVSTIFTKEKRTQVLVVFMGYFCGSFAFLVPLIFPHIHDWRGNTFWADQPFDQIINPYSVLGFTFFLFGSYLFYHLTLQRNKINISSILLTSIFFGSLYGFKSFGGLIGLLSFLISSILLLLLTRNKNIFYSICCTLLLFIPVFFLITDTTTASLVFAPGWLLTELIVGRDKLNLPSLVDVEAYYRNTNNIKGLLKIKGIELFYYLVGNIGIRLLGLIYLCKNILSTNEKLRPILSFFLISILSSFSIPLLFNLGSNAHNIVQFTPYGLLILGIFTGLFSGKAYLYLRNNKILAISTLILIILLAIPVNVKNIFQKLESPEEYITNDEFAALQFLRSNTSVDDVILIDPRKYYLDPMYVPAISQRRVYLASEVFAQQTGINSNNKMKYIVSIFDANSSEDFIRLKNEKIDYLYLKKPIQNGHLENYLREHSNTVFENKTVIIYQLARI